VVISNRLKVVVIILAGLSLGFVALLSGVWWYVNTSHCRSLLLQELNSRIPGRVTAAHHHLSLYSGTLSLRDVTVTDQKDDDLVRIAGLTIDLSPTALFRKALVVDSVNIEQPWISLQRDPTGRLNIAEAFTMEKAPKETTAPSGARPSFNIIVRHFTLSEGYLHFSEAQGNRNLTLDDVGISANGNLNDGSGVLKVSVGRSSLAYSGYSTDLNHFDLALAMKNGHIEPLVIKAENDFATLLLYGDIYQAFSDPELDLTLDMDFALGEAEALIDLDRDDTGRVKCVLKVKGQPGNPRVNLRVDYGGGRIAGRPVDRAGLQLQMTDRLATLDKLSVDAGFGALGLSGQVDMRRFFPKGFLSPPADRELASFKGRLRAAALDLASIPWEGEKFSGRLDALVDFSGSGLSLETLAADARAMIDLEDFRSKGMAQPLGIRSGITGRMQSGTLWIDAMDAAAADMFFSAGGSLDVDTRQIDARFSLETDEAASLLSIFGMSQMNGAVAVSGHVKGRFTNPVIDVSATAHGVRIHDIDVNNVMLEAGLNAAGYLKVGTLAIENRGSSVKADGDIHLFAAPFELHPDMPLNARIVFSNVEYNDFFTHAFSGPAIQGLLGGEVVVSGKLRSLKASAAVLAKGIEVEQIRLGDLAGKARFLDGKLLLDSLRLTNNRTDLEARGEISLLRKDTWQTVENPVFKLGLADGHVFLEDFTKDIAGELIIDTDLAGQFKAPRGRLALKGQDIDLGVQQIEMFVVNMQVGDKAITIEPLDIKMPKGGSIKGEGRVGFDRSFEFQLQSRGLPIDSIDRVRELKQVAGQLDIDIQGSGLIHRPEISGKMKWRGIRVKNEEIDDLYVKFNLKDNRISLEGKQTFDLSAEYDLSSKAFSVDLTMNNTRLEPWYAVAGQPELGGQISGSIRTEGYAGDLERIRATIDVQNLDLEYKGDRLAGTTDLQGTFNNGNFTIPTFHVDLLDQGHLAIEGSGDITGDVDLRAEGEMPMQAANLIAPDLIGLEGTVMLTTSIKGSLQSPALEGVIRVEQGGMKIPELQQTLHRVNGQIRFVANEDVEGNFSGMLDDGKFDIETKIELDGFRAKWIDARVIATTLPFQIPDTMEMLLSADLSMNGSLDDLLVGGEIILLEGLYYKDFKLNLLQSVQEKEREEKPQTVATVHPFLKPLRFDVGLKHRQPFVVDNNIADLEINPDIALTGTPENPVITGFATVSNGFITYQNKSFDVQQGAVNFINPYKTEAVIDIKGYVDIRDWRITISLYGPPDHLVVELSSVPQEEDADIISLLVFKKTTYEMNEGGRGVDQSPTVLLAQLLAASFGEDLKKSTGIDVLEVEAESAEDTDSTDRIKVTVGKNLSERVTVKYSVESKDGGYVQRASTEYRLLEHILVSGFQDTKGVYGGELIFRMEFRLFR
jgi:translocation and assembly module TamB